MQTVKLVWPKKGSLEEFYNGAHLEDKEREDLGIPGCRRLQQEWESGELATWNESTERGRERRLIYIRHRKMWKVQESVYKIVIIIIIIIIYISNTSGVKQPKNSAS